ncbi:MAG: efflux RND transporter permease subunit [Mariprofundales bacterium]
MNSKNPLIAPLRHRGATLLGLALLTLLLAFGVPQLKIDSGFSTLVSDSNPDKKAYQQVVSEFGSDSRTLVYVRDTELWTPNKLASLREMHDALMKLPGIRHVDDLFTVSSIVGDDKGVVVGRLISKQPKLQTAVDRIHARAMENPLLIGNIVSRDGYATALVLSLDSTQANISDAEISHAIDRVLAPMHNHFQQLFQVGSARINADLHELLIKDMSWLTPLSALVLMVVVLLMMHSLTAAIIPLISAALSMLWTMGIMGWMGLPLNILCAMLPSLVIVIGSTEDNHMVASYLRALRSDTSNPRLSAAANMLQEIGVPMLLTITTTLVGFASNIFTGMALIRDFAFAAAIAIGANGVITMLLVPIILSWLGPKQSPFSNPNHEHQGLSGILVRLFRHANQYYPKTILLATAALSALFVWQAMALKVTNNPISYFQQDNPIISQSATLHRDLAGVSLFYVSLTSKQPQAFQQPEVLAKLVEIQQFIDQQQVFDRTTSLADYLALVNRAFHGGDARFNKVPNSAALTAQYLMFLHRNTLRGLVSHNYQRAVITVRHNISDSATINQYIAELRHAAVDIAGPAIKVQVLGEGVMINGNAEQLMRDQVKSLTVLLVAVFLLMSLMFTSIKGGLISLIPNVIPIIIMFGIMGMMSIPLNPGTAMVAVIVMGIAIDNTIHMLTRYNDLSRNAANFTEAVQQTVQEEAAPMATTTLALALGFAVLLQSEFAIIAQFGALAAATILIALLINLLVTPIVMAQMRLVSLHRMLETFWQQRSLEASPLFANMSTYQTCKAILISESRELKKGDLLIEQGTIERCMFVVLCGSLEVLRRDNGQEIKLADLARGDLVGEIGFVRETLRTATVRATSNVTVLRFDYERLRTDLKYFPGVVSHLNFNISTILGERLADVIKSMAKRNNKG